MVKIVTDSSGDIPPELVKELDISITPAYILFGHKRFTDGVDLTHQEFYRKLETDKYHPLTTQASPFDFYKNFRRWEKMGEDILCITLPRELSAYIESARQAKDFIENVRVDIYNSLGVSGAQGLLVIQAAKMAKQGYNIDEIINNLNILRERTVLYAIANTTDYLVRGGRVSAATGQIASLLNIKPILEIRDGSVDSPERGFSIGHAVNKVLDLLLEDYDQNDDLIMQVEHSINHSAASRFSEELRKLFSPEVIHMARIGPTIGANVGPGAVGVAVTPTISSVIDK